MASDLERIAQEMEGVAGSRFAVTVERTERRQRENPDRTISAAALRGIRDQLGMWVATRISRRFAEGGGAPQKVEVEVNVKLDGSDDPIRETFRISVPDGGHRKTVGG